MIFRVQRAIVDQVMSYQGILQKRVPHLRVSLSDAARALLLAGLEAERVGPVKRAPSARALPQLTADMPMTARTREALFPGTPDVPVPVRLKPQGQRPDLPGERPAPVEMPPVVASERYQRLCKRHKVRVFEGKGGRMSCAQGHEVRTWLCWDSERRVVTGEGEA